MTETYRGHKIRKSGPSYLRVYGPRGGMQPRVKTVEAAKALIDATTEQRVMTPQEHGLVYSK